VRALRKRKGRTLRFFAVKANVHFTYLGQIERGEHNLSLLNIIRLAHVLGVDPGELVRGLKLPAEPGG
jgi:transcriptional regulator with XRE-family HTH domain